MRCDGVSDEDIVATAHEDNIFQYPTLREAKGMARVCLARLDAMQSEQLTQLIAYGTPTQARQANIYAMMCLYDLMRTFMVDEIGQRYLRFASTFTQMDMNAFMTRYQAENETAATWGEATVHRLKGTLSHCLVEGGYTQKGSDVLFPVLLDYEIEKAIKEADDLEALIAFNCMDGVL